MGVFLDCEKMVNEMIKAIASNQTIMKYICYDDVLVDPMLKPNLTNTQQYIYKPNTSSVDEDYRLFALPKVPLITEEKKSMICCWVKNISPSSSPQTRSYAIIFDIICHIENWQIAGGIIRPLRIMDELTENFFLRDLPFGLKRPSLENAPYQVYDSKGYFCGYRLTFESAGFTRNMCG